ncbi:unnamed protein product [Coregonus sp. 'balchen']|nr:unnamed protein product [Coregonus sp. 'balchen']
MEKAALYRAKADYGLSELTHATESYLHSRHKGRTPHVGQEELPTVGQEELPTVGQEELPTVGQEELPTVGQEELPTPPLPESSMEKMKKFRRRLSQTLRGSQTIDESLSELAEQMNTEENGIKDSGTMVHNGHGLPPSAHSVHSFLHQYTSSFKKPPLRRPQNIVHENMKMGSDGESDQASGTSSDEVQSPTGVCLRNRGNRRISAEVRLAHRLPPSSIHLSSLHPFTAHSGVEEDRKGWRRIGRGGGG